MREFVFKKEGTIIFDGDDPHCFGVHAQLNIPGKEDPGCFVEQIDNFCETLARAKKKVSVEIVIKELE